MDYSILIINEETAPVVAGNTTEVTKQLNDSKFVSFETVYETPIVVNSDFVISVLPAPEDAVNEIKNGELS